MAITTWAELKTAIDARMHAGGDLDTYIPEFIALAEAKIQTDCKLLEAETTATVTMTAGVGALPAGFVAARSVYWVGSPNREIGYVTPDKYDSLRASNTGDGFYYTIRGSSILTTPMGDGSIVITYTARFTALSDSNTANTVLTNFPDAYLYGSLMHACIHTADDPAVQKYGTLFNAAIARINQNDEDRRYAGSTLQVRTR